MLEVRAEDWPRLCRFYRDGLGWPEAVLDLENAFAMFGAKPPYIAVVGGRLGGKLRHSRVLPDLAVGDLEGALASLSAQGGTVLSPPSPSPEGYRIARACDPEGNELHLFEWLSPPASKPPRAAAPRKGSARSQRRAPRSRKAARRGTRPKARAKRRR